MSIETRIKNIAKLAGVSEFLGNDDDGQLHITIPMKPKGNLRRQLRFAWVDGPVGYDVEVFDTNDEIETIESGNLHQQSVGDNVFLTEEAEAEFIRSVVILHLEQLEEYKKDEASAEERYGDLTTDLHRLATLLQEKRSDIAEICVRLSEGERLEEKPEIEGRYVKAQIPAMLSVDGKPIDLCYDTLTTIIEFKTADGEWEHAVNHEYDDDPEEQKKEYRIAFDVKHLYNVTIEANTEEEAREIADKMQTTEMYERGKNVCTEVDIVEIAEV
jgi:hypothetical protein